MPRQKQELQDKGHQLINKLVDIIIENNPNMSREVARANVYYWINWIVLKNTQMSFWADGFHFSNMSIWQMQTVNNALTEIIKDENWKNIFISQVEKAESMRSTPSKLQKTGSSISKKGKSKKGKKPAHEANIRFLGPEDWYSDFRRFLYGEGQKLLDLPEAIALKGKILEYVKGYLAEAKNRGQDIGFAEATDEVLARFFTGQKPEPKVLANFFEGYAAYLETQRQEQSKKQEDSSTVSTSATASTTSTTDVVSTSAQAQQSVQPIKKQPRSERPKLDKAVESDIHDSICSTCFPNSLLSMDIFRALIKQKYKECQGKYRQCREYQQYSVRSEFESYCYEILIHILKEQEQQEKREQEAREEQKKREAEQRQIAEERKAAELERAALVEKQIAQSKQQPAPSTLNQSAEVCSQDSTGSSQAARARRKHHKSRQPHKARAIAGNTSLAGRIYEAAGEQNFQKMKNLLMQIREDDRFSDALHSTFGQRPDYAVRMVFVLSIAKQLAYLQALLGDDKSFSSLIQLILRNLRNRGNKQQFLDDLLMSACYGGNVHIVRILLAKGADKNKASDDGITPLSIASQNGHQEVVETLLQAGADKEKAMTGGYTPLYIASENGHEGVVGILLRAGANKEKTSEHRSTPLYIASQNGYREVVKTLLSAGADLNKAITDGSSPLYIASELGHQEIVEMLLKAGADTDKANKNGVTPLYIASQNGHQEVVEMLLKAGADKEKAMTGEYVPLYIASANGHKGVVEILLRAGVDKEKANKDGATPLWIASQNGHKEVVKILLRAGADPNKVTNGGYPPLHIAIQESHLEIVQLLLAEAKTNVNALNAQQETPLFLAVFDKCYDMISLLLSKGANASIKRYDGSSPESVAEIYKDDKLIAMLSLQKITESAGTSSVPQIHNSQDSPSRIGTLTSSAGLTLFSPAPSTQAAVEMELHTQGNTYN